MNDILISQITLIIADLLALLPFILGLYILALNPRERANQVTALYILLLSVINIAIVLVLRNPSSAWVSAALRVYAALAPLAGPATVLMALYILQAGRIQGWKGTARRGQVWRRGLWLLWLLPAVLTLLDSVLGTRLYFAMPGLPAPEPALLLAEAHSGVLGAAIILLYTILPPVGLLFLISAWILRRQIPEEKRNLAWGLLVLTGATALSYGLARTTAARYYQTLVIDALFGAVYALAAYRQILGGLFAAPRLKLQPRLTILLLTIVFPILAFLGITSNRLVYALAAHSTDNRLRDTGTLVGNEVQQWLDFNVAALRSIAEQPEIISMDPAKQEPILRNMDASHGYMYLVSTTDVLGRNVARSDGKAPKDYSDRLWYQRALRGESPVTQVLIGRTSKRPALVVSTPIRNEAGNIVGVLMFASTLDDLSATVLQARLGETGFAYLTDEQGLLLAHPKMLDVPLSKLEDFSQQPPLQAVDAQTGEQRVLTTYEDANGLRWRAYATVLPNGWTVVVQQQEDEFLAPPRTFTALSLGMLALLGTLLVLLVWASIRQIAAPLEYLTDAAQAISAGELERSIKLTGEDEIATLGSAFAQMATRLRNTIQQLEQRVSERTEALERRTAQLQTVIEIGQAISGVQEMHTLLDQTVHSVSEKFGFYHTGVFLLDESGQYVVLQAANSPGGKRMLAAGHRLLVGKQGIVGYVAFTRKPRIALNVGADAVHFNNPNLPDTQSEAALPLIAGGELLGVLDVQSTRSEAFTQSDIEVLQALADQIATAMQNVRLAQETQRLLEAQREASGLWTRRIWKRQVEVLTHPAVKRTAQGIRLLSEAGAPPSGTEPLSEDAPYQVLTDPQDAHLLHVPLVRNETIIGYLQARKPADAPPWTAEERAFMQRLSEELGPALDGARLYQETQINAWQQRISVDIASRLRQNLDLEAILRTTVTQVREALDLSEVHIQLSGNNETTA